MQILAKDHKKRAKFSQKVKKNVNFDKGLQKNRKNTMPDFPLFPPTL